MQPNGFAICVTFSQKFYMSTTRKQEIFEYRVRSPFFKFNRAESRAGFKTAYIIVASNTIKHKQYESSGYTSNIAPQYSLYSNKERIFVYIITTHCYCALDVPPTKLVLYVLEQ